ncbi:probable purine permease 4 [Salvia miltiorrhiza]|uniref:probable purine permease 4 n=1 Tax=Salvia miltiorrhiza TaxID=226208 RepID=UPI0025ABC327|nr:probable purine permease 4 [Salvia miltiorrhiza]XP_057808845.1 probable purine permease 4 [Salvia miltiorrhiza]
MAEPPPPPPPNFATAASQEDKTTLMNIQTNSSPTTDDDEHDHLHEPNPNQQNSPKSSKRYTLLLTINCAVLIAGSVAATLITKFYFIHHGSSRWVSTWVQTAGFPLLLPPILLLRGRRLFSGFTPRLTLLSLAVGVFLGVSNLLFSWGTSYLPVSTSSLLLSSQLAFNLILSAAIAKQKVTFNNINCVILLTLSSILLALSSSGDRPAALTRRRYLIGFFSTLGAGISFAVYLPVMEVIYREVRCYAMVVEMQLLMGLSATAFATAGMAADGGFTDLKSESTAGFDRGPAAYWWTIWGAAVAWQMSFLGTAGMVFLTTSLTGGVCMTALLAVNVAGGVVVYGDEFGGVKAVATVLCVWGFCSYLYGIYAKSKERNRRGRSVEMNEIMV